MSKRSTLSDFRVLVCIVKATLLYRSLQGRSGRAMKQSVYSAVSNSGEVPTNIVSSGASLVSLRIECCLRINPFCKKKYIIIVYLCHFSVKEEIYSSVQTYSRPIKFRHTIETNLPPKGLVCRCNPSS